MRVIKSALAFSLVAGMMLVAQSARAGFATPLAEGFWFMNNTNDPNNNFCEVGVSGTEFEAFGSILGTAQKTAVRVDYDTLQPTSASRNTKKISVKQNQYGYLNVLINGATVSGGLIPVQKCSISGSVNTAKSTPNGSVGVNCSGGDITQVISANNATLLQSAFSNSPNIKFKVNLNNGNWSLSIKCKGDASLD